MLLGVFAACDGGQTATPETGESAGSSNTESSETQKTEDSETEEQSGEGASTSETAGEESSDTEGETKPDDPYADVEPGIPSYVEDLSYVTADGYELKQYDMMDIEDYYAAYKYYVKEGYTLYSENKVGNSSSATFVKGDAYAVVMFNGHLEELYLGYSESGANAFPEVFSSLGDDSVIPTITQHYSSDSNGMCYFIKLSDGSFLVLDGGYDFDTDDAYDTLVKLNGSADGIHIRAWLISHSHGDHYEMFETFSQNYADKVTLDRVMYSPINSGVVGYDAYLNKGVKDAVARFDGAVLCPVHTGMSFTFGNIEFEILAAPEHIYKETDPEDFNESSIVVRAVHDQGSMIFLADSGIYTCEWMLDAYDDGLKSDMVQVAHHGGETANKDVYDAIQANTLFWPCNEPLLNSERGLYVKQHILNAEYSKEHLLHSYGNITRPINYKPVDYEYIDLFPVDVSQVYTSPSVSDFRIEDGVIKYEVAAGGDPNFCYQLRNVSTKKCNAIRVVVSSNVLEGGLYETPGEMYYTAGSDKALNFSENRMQRLGITGASEDGKTTLIIYLGDTEDYTSRLTSLRWDFGTEIGQTVEIYSIEGFFVNVDAE